MGGEKKVGGEGSINTDCDYKRYPKGKEFLCTYREGRDYRHTLKVKE